MCERRARDGKEEHSIPDESVSVEAWTLFWYIHSRGDGVEVVCILHVAQRQRTGEVGHCHGVEALHGERKKRSRKSGPLSDLSDLLAEELAALKEEQRSSQRRWLLLKFGFRREERDWIGGRYDEVVVCEFRPKRTERYGKRVMAIS